jgi:MFS family permease
MAERVGGWLLTALFLIAAILLFGAIYFALPQNQHFSGLLTIGVLSLVFSIGSYLAESFSREPTAQRSLAWGFFGMGFAVLFLTIGLGPTYGTLSLAGQVIGLLLLVVALAVAVGLIGWRRQAVRSTEGQLAARRAWRPESAPSALNYAAATSPTVPRTPPPPTEPGGSERP